MEFEVIVSQILEQVKGQSARGEWVKQEVIFEYPDNTFGRKVCISFWNERAQRAAALRPGERILVSVNLESREHNGRWYTEARGWKIDQPQAGAAQAAPGAGVPGTDSPYPAYSNPTPVPNVTAAAPAAAPIAAEAGPDDLPF